jgi:hypothetical protein
MNYGKLLTLTLFAGLLGAITAQASISINYDFTSNTTGDWAFVTESTSGTLGAQEYLTSSTTKGNFTGHDGLMRWRPHHTGTASSQASLFSQVFAATEDLSAYTFSTTGIHTNRTSDGMTVRFAVQYDDGGIKWAVSDQPIGTSSGTATPVAGTWDLSTFTFSALDAGNLLGGPGSTVTASTVLQNATGVGIFSIFTSGSWWADRATQIDSITVAVPESSTYALLTGFLAIGFVIVKRRRHD